MTAIATTYKDYMWHLNYMAFYCYNTFSRKVSQFFGGYFRINSHLVFYPFIQVATLRDILRDTLSIILGITLGIINHVHIHFGVQFSPYPQSLAFSSDTYSNVR